MLDTAGKARSSQLKEKCTRSLSSKGKYISIGHMNMWNGGTREAESPYLLNILTKMLCDKFRFMSMSLAQINEDFHTLTSSRY
jgi:hypothetical protein